MTPCRGSLAAGKKLSFECPPLVIGAPRFSNEQVITPLSAEVASLGRGFRDSQIIYKITTGSVFGKLRLSCQRHSLLQKWTGYCFYSANTFYYSATPRARCVS